MRYFIIGFVFVAVLNVLLAEPIKRLPCDNGFWEGFRAFYGLKCTR